MMLTWRERLVAVGAAIGIDVLFWLVRWAIDAEVNFGNGALWVVPGCAVIAVTRRAGRPVDGSASGPVGSHERHLGVRDGRRRAHSRRSCV